MKILLIDDCDLFAEGLHYLLSANGIEFIGITNTIEDTLIQINQVIPDIILIDMDLIENVSSAFIRKIKNKYPLVKIIVLSSFENDNNLFETIKAGASGYLSKKLTKENFIGLLNNIQSGYSPLSPGLASRILKEFFRLQKERERHTNIIAMTELLSHKQIEILRLLSQGFIYKEIAAKLDISESGVKYHIKKITHHLHLNSRAQIISFAAKLSVYQI
jgi:two-component system NarL family response regulator